MTFTRSDLNTFLIGAAVAVAVSIAEVAVGLDGQDFGAIDWGNVGGNMAVGMVTALGRYVLTRLPEIIAARRTA